MSMAEEKPTAAFVISLIGGVLILIGGLGQFFLGALCGSIIAVIPGGAGVGAAVFLYMAIGLLCGIAVIVGAVLINKAQPASVKNGSIVVLVFSVISIISGGGFIIGLILGIIGGILGLVWKPSRIAPYPPA